MAVKADLVDWVIDALKAHAGSASIVEVCEWIWRNHEADLRESGDLFYTWQYDVRWAATRLRKDKVLRATTESDTGIWELA